MTVLYVHEVEMVSCTESSYLLSLGGSISLNGSRLEAEEGGWGLDSDAAVFEPQLGCYLSFGEVSSPQPHVPLSV